MAAVLTSPDCDPARLVELMDGLEVANVKEIFSYCWMPVYFGHGLSDSNSQLNCWLHNNTDTVYISPVLKSPEGGCLIFTNPNLNSSFLARSDFITTDFDDDLDWSEFISGVRVTLEIFLLCLCASHWQLLYTSHTAVNHFWCLHIYSRWGLHNDDILTPHVVRNEVNNRLTVVDIDNAHTGRVVTERQVRSFQSNFYMLRLINQQLSNYQFNPEELVKKGLDLADNREPLNIKPYTDAVFPWLTSLLEFEAPLMSLLVCIFPVSPEYYRLFGELKAIMVTDPNIKPKNELTEGERTSLQESLMADYDDDELRSLCQQYNIKVIAV